MPHIVRGGLFLRRVLIEPREVKFESRLCFQGFAMKLRGVDSVVIWVTVKEVCLGTLRNQCRKECISTRPRRNAFISPVPFILVRMSCATKCNAALKTPLKKTTLLLSRDL